MPPAEDAPYDRRVLATAHARGRAPTAPLTGLVSGDPRLPAAFSRHHRARERGAGPAGEGGGSYAGGGSKGFLTQCGMPEAGSRAFLNGHSFVVNIEEDAGQTVTGAFEKHHVRPGTYELHHHGPIYRRLMQVVVTAGQVNDLEDVNVCDQD
jgi:hypothetical protein